MKPDILWIIRHKILSRDNGHEPAVRKVIRKMSGDLFIDIGSNRGWISDVARKSFKRVIMIDPNPRYLADIHAAISDTNGRAVFHIFDGIGTADSLIENPHILGRDYQNNNDEFLVETIRYDDLGLDADLVKIDVEGAELKVIAGMNAHLPKNIILEEHNERESIEIFNQLSRKGYAMMEIDRTHFLFSLNSPKSRDRFNR